MSFLADKGFTQEQRTFFDFVKCYIRGESVVFNDRKESDSYIRNSLAFQERREFFKLMKECISQGLEDTKIIQSKYEERQLYNLLHRSLIS
jgi:hypothetical protein